ncbi:MAG: UbiD family decarboxylase [Rhodospirillaceae bacterium]|jgi:2,5-furandicarboxylate decarboxylase 1|nr:UbiD family decarboxylase [Rhodospirillaceae bacterium]MBT3494683.1 UbiD family decarboxylase [Rhodospirillaceae bacterium]MBT3780461.1 UbiD family decarboxylase [Rhodospirillaceae bacterium]MBT3977245.1 UbiD family decarboxylase [Rhodospirillaceae bacterium]MBT4167517.1 UbiD family decarboxylase [Rhodospirillaceae bacterium]
MTAEKAPAPSANHCSKNLREWLTHLAATDRLAVAKPGVGLVHELAAVSDQLELDKAVLFPKPDGHEIPVAANLLASRKWIGDCLGVSEDDLIARYQDAVRNPLPWVEVEDAPVQAVVHTDVDINGQLPVPTHNELDSGPYIAAGLMISRNPKNGIQNVSIHRCQISGKDRIGVLLLPRHTWTYSQMAEEAGQALEVAIVIGVDPASLLASQAIVPMDFDEMEIVGALHGAPVEMVKCKTNNVRVPAHAEIVLEGRVLPGVAEPEGPFGEFPQYYGRRANRHVIQVDTITHREGAIFHTIVGGGMEHLLLGGLPREATILESLQRHDPAVLDVHLSRGGICRYHLVVKIDKKQEGQAKNIMMGAFAAHYDIKQVVVVDKDVNIHDGEAVEWAIATRFQADQDLLVVNNTQASKLDPTTTDGGVGAKMGLDATIPLAADDFTFTVIKVPGAGDVDLDAVLDDASAATAIIANE